MAHPNTNSYYTELTDISEPLIEQVIRSLRSETSWIRATSVLLNLRSPVKIVARLVTLPNASTPIEPPALTALQETILALVPDIDRQKVETYLQLKVPAHKGLKRSPNPIHAEAGLMGLISDPSYLPASDKESARVDASSGFDRISSVSLLLPPLLPQLTSLQSKETVIGVGKRCCWCCYRLHQLLNFKHLASSSLTDDEKSLLKKLPSLVVPGSHAIIYPWGAPTGVPQGVLRQMRDELLRILIAVARREAPGRCSPDCGGYRVKKLVNYRLAS